MSNVSELATISSLRGFSGGSASPTIWVNGYSLPADGGEGMFVFVSGSTAIDNGGTTIIDALGNRYMREYNHSPINVCWFGAKNNGIYDNTSAVTAAFVALPATGGQLYFPSGKFLFSSQIMFNMPSGFLSLSVAGDAADASVLYWPNTKGMTITANAQNQTVHFRDLSINTGAVNQYYGLTINGVAFGGQPSDFCRVNFRGDPGGASGACWNVALSIIGLSTVSYVSCGFFSSGGTQGIGLALSGLSSSPNYSIIHNISLCSFFSCGIGLYYGTYVQGVTVSQCNFQNGTTAIFIPSSSAGASQLAVNNSQFAGTGTQISINTPLSAFLFTGNLVFVSSNSTGIAFTAATDGTTFSANSIVGETNSIGISVSSGSTDSATIVGNTFAGLQTAVSLDSSVNGWNVQANAYNNVITKVSYSGTGNQIGIVTE